MVKLFCALSSFTAVSLLHLTVSHTPTQNLRQNENHHHDDHTQQQQQQQQQQQHPIFAQEPQDQYTYTDDAQKDQIISLPGLNFQPDFNQFSGYIPVSDTRNIHYWYIESSNNPSTDPVVFWTNGGPGCSGLLGLGTEFGPFLFEKDGILSSNPNTWNQVANILYVEQPAGVGFSYYTDESDRKVGDNRAAVDNYQLIVEFLNRFPERRSNEFYIASESYGGHYIPHLAREILDRNTEGAINFRGFLIGNPYVDPFSNDVTMVQTYYMHGLIALPLFLKWETHCTDPNHYPADKCGVIMDAMFKESGDGINPYALDFPVCTEQDNDDYPPTATRSHSYNEDEVDFVLDDEVDFVLDANEISATSAIKRNLVSGTASAQSNKLMKHSSARAPPFLPQQDVYYPCAENHLFDYLNREDVKVALHVEQSKDWSMCSDEIEYSEQDSNSPQMSVYEDLLDRARVRGTNLKIMIFSGDDDSVCSTASTQYWIYNIGSTAKDGKLWNAWKYENQTAGYLTEFDLGDTDSSFLFVTVHGAGHEVPAYRPVEALAMFKSYFNGEWDV